MDRIFLLDVGAYRAIREWCRRSPRREVGGVLAGRGRYIVQAFKVPNVSNAAASSFVHDALALRAARARARAADLRVLGEWHSHPLGYARPSPADIECQSGLELIWSGIQGRPRLWLIRGRRAQVLRAELRLLLCRSLDGRRSAVSL